MDTRVEVLEFAEEMEKILKQNYYKGGWKECQDGYLDQKLMEEVAEYFIATGWTQIQFLKMAYDKIQSARTDHREDKELVDIANIAMMLWDINRRKN